MRAESTAIVFEQPGQLALRELLLEPQQPDECIIDVEWTGISTGTERLLWTGDMPSFPGMGYPLVPGYEAIGRVVTADNDGVHQVNQRVFIPGANCYQGARGLFGASASQLIANANRIVPLADDIGEEGVLFALAATAYHALQNNGHQQLPELIVGYGVLGRLIARLVVALGGAAPMVWETNAARTVQFDEIPVMHPKEDQRSNYGVICDVSGDARLLDTLIQKLRPGGEVVLAGFYAQPLSFEYPPAFMREARIRVAAEWKPDDLIAVTEMVMQQKLSLDGLITHRQPAASATDAYETAFNDRACLKMVLDWSN